VGSGVHGVGQRGAKKEKKEKVQGRGEKKEDLLKERDLGPGTQGVEFADRPGMRAANQEKRDHKQDLGEKVDLLFREAQIHHPCARAAMGDAPKGAVPPG